MKTISPWINFNGNAEEAFNFYKSVLGGEFGTITRFKDVAGTEAKVSEQEANKIMRITLPFGNEGMLIGNDVPQSMGTVSEHENRSKIYVAVDSREEAKSVTSGLSVGGEIEVPLDDSAEQTGFSMFRDQYGIEWIVEFNASH